MTQFVLLFATLPLSFAIEVEDLKKFDQHCLEAPDERLYQLCELVNRERSKRNLYPLTLAPVLNEVIQKHTDEMAAYEYLDHENRKGEDPFDRLERAKVVYKRAAENIAWGQKTPKDVMRSWMNSPGHRKNILGPNYQYIGLGFSESYWGQVFTAH